MNALWAVPVLLAGYWLGRAQPIRNLRGRLEWRLMLGDHAKRGWRSLAFLAALAVAHPIETIQAWRHRNGPPSIRLPGEIQVLDRSPEEGA